MHRHWGLGKQARRFVVRSGVDKEQPTARFGMKILAIVACLIKQAKFSPTSSTRADARLKLAPLFMSCCVSCGSPNAKTVITRKRIIAFMLLLE